MTEVTSLSRGNIAGAREVQAANPKVARAPDVVTINPDQETKGANQTAGSEGRSAKVTEMDLAAVVQDMKDMAAQHNINLDFSIHKSTGETVIKVVDAATHEVVRQLPPEELLQLHETLEELAGYLLNAKV